MPHEVQASSMPRALATALVTPSSAVCTTTPLAGGTGGVKDAYQWGGMVAVLSNGPAVWWGPGQKETGLGYKGPAEYGPALAISAAAGLNNGGAIGLDESGWTWGEDQYGQLGNGTQNNSQPIDPGTGTVWPNPAIGPATLNGVVALSGGYHELALRNDGTLWAWGDDTYGELGNGGVSSTPVLSPVQVSLPNVVQIASGKNFSMALKADGTVWTWGDNGAGELGQGGVGGGSATPGQVSRLSGIVSIYASIASSSAIALKSDGSVWTWGDNGNGQLGNGTSGNSNGAPTPVAGLSGVVAVSISTTHALALKSDGTLWAWGDNSTAELGLGDASGNHLLPTQATKAEAGITQVVAGDGYSETLTSGGSVYGWGDNGAYQLGVVINGLVNNGTPYLTPIQASIPANGSVAQATTCPGGPVPGSGPNPGPAISETLGSVPLDELPIHCSCGKYPVNTATGNFWHEFDDLSIPGRGVSIDLKRTYNSLNAAQNGRFGYGWSDSYSASLSFDPSGNPTVHEENGGTLPFTLSGSTYTAPTRVLATLVKNGDGSFTLTRQDQTKLSFDATGQLISEVDRNGYVTNLAYSNGVLTTVTDPAGRTLTFTYTGSNVTGVADQTGRSLTYGYDSSGQLASVTDINHGVTAFTYDAGGQHLLLTMTDPRNGVVTNVYDSSGRVSQQTDPMNRVTKFTYGTGTTLITYPNGNQAFEQYQNNGLVARTEGYGTSLASTTTYSYDPTTMGVTTISDNVGNLTKQTWDTNGNLLTTQDPLNHKTTYTYNSLNEVLTKTDALNVQTTNTYNSNGNLTSTSTPLVGSTSNQSVSYAYDPAHPGDITQLTDPNGKITKYAYDSYGNRISTTDPAGDLATMTYDTIGRMLTNVTPRGNVTGGTPANFKWTYTYDPFGDVLTVTDPLNHKTTNVYDADRNLTKVTDANQHATVNTYDADNELTQVQRADASTLLTGYDGNGNVQSQTDGLNHATTYAYDVLNRRISSTDPLGRVSTFGYTGTGQLGTSTDGSSGSTVYTYDQAGRLVAKDYSDGQTPNVVFGYDADNQRIQMQDGTGISTYSYDSLHRMTQSKNGAGATVQYGYDLANNLATITYPGGTNKVTRGYDSAERLTSIVDWLGNSTTFAYDADSNRTSQTNPNNTKATSTYNNADQLTQITDTVGSKGIVFLNLSYTRDADGQLTAEGSQAFGYDAINRLGSASPGGSATSYGYDAADHLTSIVITGSTTTTLAYDQADEATSNTQMNGSTQVAKYTYGYDGAGRRTSSTDQNNTVTSYTWDDASRLTGFGSSSTYTYDGDGLRASKTVSGTATAETWDVADGSPLLIVDGTLDYVTGPGGLPLEQINGKTVYWYHQDQLGSTRVMTDSRGNSVETYSFNPYGGQVSSTGTVINPFKFAGQYADSESGFIYLRARYYDPAAGQFLSRDPASRTTREPYAYVNDNPLNGSDDLGLFPSGPNPALSPTPDTSGPDWSYAIGLGSSSLGQGFRNMESELGKALQQGKSCAGGTNLRDAASTADDFEGLSRGLGVVGVVVGIGWGIANGESAGEIVGSSVGALFGAALGEGAGGLACAGLAAITDGLGAAACPALTGIGAAAGAYAGAQLGGGIGGWLQSNLAGVFEE